MAPSALAALEDDRPRACPEQARVGNAAMRGGARCRGFSSRTRRRISDYIERRVAERFTLTDMAEVACMSRFHFTRMFRHTFGASPMEYVLRERIERAKPMLLDNRQSIADIAAALGFYDQSHFTRWFRRVTGRSPTQFVVERIKPRCPS